MRFEIFDRYRHRGLLEKAGAVDQRLVGIGAIEVVGENFVEPLDVRILHGIDVIAIKARQFSKVVSHVFSSRISSVIASEAKQSILSFEAGLLVRQAKLACSCR